MKNLSINQQIILGDVLINLTNEISTSKNYKLTVNLFEYIEDCCKKNSIKFNYLEDIMSIMDNIVNILKINYVVKYKLDNLGGETNTIIIKDLSKIVI